MDPKDPNFIRDSSPGATGYRLFDEKTIETLDSLRRPLQIIVVSLMTGVMFFGGYVIYTSDGPRSFFGPDRMDIMLGLAAVCAVASIIVPRLVGQTHRSGTPKLQPAMQSLLTGDPDHDRAVYEAQGLQLTTIIGCALLEAAAFANLVALMQGNDDIHSVVVVIMLAGIAMRFPTRGRYLRKIHFAVEEARLEQPLSK